MGSKRATSMVVGQMAAFIIFEIFVVLTIWLMIWLNPTYPWDKTTSRSITEPMVIPSEKYINLADAFQTSVATCLEGYSRDAISLCKLANSTSCKIYIKNYIKLRAADCFEGVSYPGLDVKVNPPFMIRVNETLSRFDISLSINTVLTQDDTETILDKYSFSLLKEDGKSRPPPSWAFGIDGMETTLQPLSKTDKAYQYFENQAIISYKMPPGKLLNDTVGALPLINRENLFYTDWIRPQLSTEESKTLLSELANDELITYDPSKTDFDSIRKKLLQFKEVRDVTRNARFYPNYHMTIPSMIDMMRGMGQPGSDDPFFRFQWYLRNTGQFSGTPGADISIIGAWNITRGNPNVTVALIGEGIYPTPDTSPNILTNSSFNFLTSRANTQYIRDDPSGNPVVSIIVSLTDNRRGIAGICPGCKIINMEVASGKNGADSRTLMNAVLLAVGRGAKIITFSLSGPQKSDYEEYLLHNLSHRGIIFFAAAGNDGNDKKAYPAAYDGVIAVGATDNTDRIASFSNHGDWVDIYAPGDLIISQCGASSYCFTSGTSMATPMAAGVAGLMRSLRPDLTPDEALVLMQKNADDNGHGVKRVNAEKTLKAIAKS